MRMLAKMKNIFSFLYKILLAKMRGFEKGLQKIRIDFGSFWHISMAKRSYYENACKNEKYFPSFYKILVAKMKVFEKTSQKIRIDFE